MSRQFLHVLARQGYTKLLRCHDLGLLRLSIMSPHSTNLTRLHEPFLLSAMHVVDPCPCADPDPLSGLSAKLVLLRPSFDFLILASQAHLDIAPQ